MNFNFIPQLDEKDCGVACLAMILKHYKTEIPIHKLRELSGTDLDGTSAFGLLIADSGRGKLKKPVSEFNKEWTGVVLIPTPKEIYQPTKEKIAGLTSFLPLIWKQKGLVFHIILASIFITWLI